MVVATRSKKKAGISISRALNVFMSMYGKTMGKALHIMRRLFQQCIVNQDFICAVARSKCDILGNYRSISLRMVDGQQMRLLREVIHILQTVFKKHIADLDMRSALRVFKHFLVASFWYAAVAKGKASSIGEDGSRFEQELIKRSAYGDE
jgi:hypothetical protein